MRPSRRLPRIACIFFGSVACASGRAATVCEDPAEDSFVAIGYVDHQLSRLAERAGSTDQENQELDVLVASASGRLAWGFSHRYLIFDFSDIEPQTNAHLHTSFAPLHWRPEGRPELRFSAAVALSASSNVMGHPQEWGRDTLQLLAAFVATPRLSDALSLRYGLCGDHRWGEYRLYPTVGIAWRFRSRWLLELGFPSSRLRFEPLDTVSSAVGIAPDGNEWHVEDRNFELGSQFIYEALALEWTTDWRVHPRLTLSLRLGRQLDNRYEMTLANGERLTVSGAAANRFGFSVRWRF